MPWGMAVIQHTSARPLGSLCHGEHLSTGLDSRLPAPHGAQWCRASLGARVEQGTEQILQPLLQKCLHLLLQKVHVGWSCWVGSGSPRSTGHPWRTSGCREEDIASPLLPRHRVQLSGGQRPTVLIHPLLCLDAACFNGEASTTLQSLENLDPVFSGALGGSSAFNERCVQRALRPCQAPPCRSARLSC